MVHRQNNIYDDLPTFYQQIPPPRGGGIIISVHVTLSDKYQHVYLYDSDTQETRRILHVEWSTAHRPAKYAVVTQFVHGIHENEEDDLVSYYINESLFDCIRAAPLPYNQQRRLIERPN